MPKPYAFFDLGETLVDLSELLAWLGLCIAERFPAIANEADTLVHRWIIESSQGMPREPKDEFVSEFLVASRVLSRLLGEAGTTISVPEAGGILRKAWDAFELRVRFCSGVSNEWLGEIRSLTAGMGVVTDGDRENVFRLFRRLDLEKYFDVVVTSEEVRSYKPNPHIYAVALEALHARPHDSLFISDSPLDLRGAAALGMATALMGRAADRGSLELPPGAYCVSKPQDLNGILREFAKVGHFEPAEGARRSSSSPA